MSIDFEPGTDKSQTKEIHDLIQIEIENIAQTSQSSDLCKTALMMIDNLNILIYFDNTYDSYLSLCQKLRLVLQELSIENRVVSRIAERFGADSFFLICFLDQALHN